LRSPSGIKRPSQRAVSWACCRPSAVSARPGSPSPGRSGSASACRTSTNLMPPGCAEMASAATHGEPSRSTPRAGQSRAAVNCPLHCSGFCVVAQCSELDPLGAPHLHWSLLAVRAGPVGGRSPCRSATPALLPSSFSRAFRPCCSPSGVAVARAPATAAPIRARRAAVPPAPARAAVSAPTCSPTTTTAAPAPPSARPVRPAASGRAARVVPPARGAAPAAASTL